MGCQDHLSTIFKFRTFLLGLLLWRQKNSKVDSTSLVSFKMANWNKHWKKYLEKYDIWNVNLYVTIGIINTCYWETTTHQNVLCLLSGSTCAEFQAPNLRKGPKSDRTINVGLVEHEFLQKTETYWSIGISSRWRHRWRRHRVLRARSWPASHLGLIRLPGLTVAGVGVHASVVHLVDGVLKLLEIRLKNNFWCFR